MSHPPTTALPSRSKADPAVLEQGSLRALQRAGLLAVAVLAATAMSALAAVPAVASKEVVAYFGTESGSGTKGGEFGNIGDVAVNVSTGEIYVTDGGGGAASNSRIQRFASDDNGTPADPYDDSYPFLSAWGAGVLTDSSDYEICTVATSCRSGLGTGGNGSAAGNGALDNPQSLAVDQDTGDVYVLDSGNNRVGVYDADGTFLRSFGFDVVASGPGDSGTGYEICVAADGDVCKPGTSGPGVGQVGSTNLLGAIAVSQPDGNPTAGTVFVADGSNQRVGTYALNGTSPSSFGSAADFPVAHPRQIAVDSRGIVYATDSANGQQIARYDTSDANGAGVGFLAPIPPDRNEVQQVTISATAGQFRLTFGGDTTADLPFNAFAFQVKEALWALPSIGVGNVSVSGGPGGTGGSPFRITFTEAFAATDVPELVASNGATPLSGGTGAAVTTTATASEGAFPPSNNNGTVGLEVDPDSDGGGPDEDVLYALRTTAAAGDAPEPPGGSARTLIHQIGPLNAPGLTAPPSDADDVHGAIIGFKFARGLGLNHLTGRQFVGVDAQLASTGGPRFGRNASGVYVLDDAGGVATATLDSVSDVTATTATVHGTINPNGPPDVSYRLEYSLDGTDWVRTPDVVLGSQTDPQPLDVVLDPPGGGLEPNTFYHVRIVATRPFNPPVVTPAQTFTTLVDAPDVETTGSPIRTATTAQLSGRVNPRGTATDYHFEYGEAPCDANTCAATATQSAGSGQRLRLVSEPLSGLDPDTTYHYRLVADNGNPGSPVFGDDMTITTRADDDPLAHGHFQKVAIVADEGAFTLSFQSATTPDLAFDASADQVETALESLPAIGAGNVSVSGGPEDQDLHPYIVTFTDPSSGVSFPKITAESGNPPLLRQPGALPGLAQVTLLPGPPGSDRAWEQVNLPDTGGNPVVGGLAFSDDGDRAVYQIPGGTPVGDSGNLETPYFAQRTDTSTDSTPHRGSWEFQRLLPPRAETSGPQWVSPYATSDLSGVVSHNFDLTTNADSIWRLVPGGSPTKLAEFPEVGIASFYVASDDASAVVATSGASLDPNHPGAGGLYEVGGGTPRLVNVLPDGSTSPCGINGAPLDFANPPGLYAPRSQRWISADGRYAFFHSKGPAPCSEAHPQLYVRDLDGATTSIVSGPILSGPSCGAGFIKSTPDAAFFWTQARLDPADTATASCDNDPDGPETPDGDVYRYDLSAGDLECVTCVVPGLDADVVPDNEVLAGGGRSLAAGIGIAQDGSRVYFRSANRLQAGAAANGLYRVHTATGDLRFIAELGGPGGGDIGFRGGALTPDGAVMIFHSAHPSLNPLGGADNGGTAQYYRYDDRDRSLVCVSCPQDGAAPAAAVPESQLSQFTWGQSGPNTTALTEDGNLAFRTPTPLVSDDHNTAAVGDAPVQGSDVYEWRDGRLFLITDGETSWENENVAPTVSGVSPSGRDVYFLASAQLTPDAIDGFQRLYSARIGGGFDFPEPPPPCSLEDCQGPPSPVPTDPGSGSGAPGPGNQGKDRTPPATTKKKSCKKIKSKKKRKKCKKRKKKGGRR